MEIKECLQNLNCKIVFSALDSSVAGAIEEEFAKKGYIVSSNSKNHRMDADVPLIIPEVNPTHLSIIKKQQKRTGKGFIVTNPNCSVIGLVTALKPIYDSFGLKRISVTTMQALSGAGYPGVASMDIIDNVVPYIGGEEEKIETESLKLLGSVKSDAFEYSNIKVSAQCNRVNVSDGHLEIVSFGLEKKVLVEEIKQTLSEFNPLIYLNLPSSPKQPIVVKDERPQPKYDRMSGNGMSCVVGGIKEDSILGQHSTDNTLIPVVFPFILPLL